MMKKSNKLPSLDKSSAAMIRATHRAAEIAKQHNQPLLFWRDGEVVRVPVDELPKLEEIKISKLKS